MTNFVSTRSERIHTVSTTTSQPKKRVRTRLAMLRATIDLLGQEDGRVVRVEDVVSQVGMTRTTFYNHFDSREALIDTVAFELTHHFNSIILPIINLEKDAARRVAMATRYYLSHARADRKWAWAVVNVSLNSKVLFGEATHNDVTRNIVAGQADGTFRLQDLNAGRDMLMGTVLAAFLHILRAKPTSRYQSDMAMIILRGLGVPTRKAERIVAEPLPPLPSYSGPFSTVNAVDADE